MSYPAPYNPYAYTQFMPQMGQQNQFNPQQNMQPQNNIQQAAMPQQGVQGISPASRPVTNREEAISVAADFTGSPMVFPDITHNRVYMKRWNFNTGAADFVEYAPVQQEPKQQADPVAVFATVDDLSDLKNIVDHLRSEVEKLKKPVGKVVKKNDTDE